MTSNKKATTDSGAGSTLDLLYSIVGIVAALGAVYYAIKLVGRQTDTNLVSNEAKKVLGDRAETQRMRRAVDTYQLTGEWQDQPSEPSL